MSATTLILLRRVATISSLLGILLLIVGGFFGGGPYYVMSFLGALLALVAWGAGIWLALGNRRVTWLVLHAYFALAAVVTVVMSFLQIHSGDQQLAAIFIVTFVPLAVAGLASGTVTTEDALERGTAAVLGGLGLILLIVGGTTISDTTGANPQLPETIRMLGIGYHLYLVTGILALATWIIGLIVSARIQAWGWFATVLLLPGIGAFMFGLFGPSLQDVLQARENAKSRREAGIRI